MESQAWVAGREQDEGLQNGRNPDFEQNEGFENLGDEEEVHSIGATPLREVQVAAMQSFGELLWADVR